MKRTLAAVLLAALFLGNATAQGIDFFHGSWADAQAKAKSEQKLIFVDAFASWCGPCRVSNKGLAKLYPKFKDKGFEILGVSLDEDHADWQKAVKKDKISWLQVIDDGGWESVTVSKWRISAIPTSYLINKEGVLIAMDLEGKELEKALKQLLGE